ncbi:MAG TPA: hypothetical protein VHN14_08535 [Kofleriaceae bacterium]|jgi:hypothetical protein|nr:hypothetical protein [Kofleriaceae bacterium]
MIRLAIAACVAWLAGALGSAAHASPITVGLFAPSAPFPSTAARVELANRLGEAIGKALNVTGSGRVYARAADFATAVKRGEITLALVDPAYLAGAGVDPMVIAASLAADRKTVRAWQFVARDGAKLAELAGKHVLVPSLGGREQDFVINVLLGGGVGREFFARIEVAPDTASAIAALGLGKADAAVVPVAGELPPGIHAVPVLPALPALPNPVLVVYGAMAEVALGAVRDAVTRFQGDATIVGFRDPDDERDARVVRDLASRFSPPVKRGPFAVPTVRLVVGDLLEGRRFAIERTPVTAFATAPTTR